MQTIHNDDEFFINADNSFVDSNYSILSSHFNIVIKAFAMFLAHNLSLKNTMVIAEVLFLISDQKHS